MIAVLRWLFTDEDGRADFWRGNVYSLAALRKSKDGATKFAKIHEDWQRADKKKVGVSPPVDRELSRAVGEAIRGESA